MGENWIVLNVFGLYHMDITFQNADRLEFKYAKLMATYLVNIKQFA